MATLHIDGVGAVTVGDEFLKLSPEQQDATVQEIAAAARPKVSQGKALALGALQGATANFGDEIIAGGTAATKRDRRGGESLRGGSPEAQSADQDASLVEVRKQIKEARETHPWTFLGGQAVGAVASIPGRLMQAATLPARMLRGGAVGGTYGAAAGAGEGETPGERLTGAAIGGLGGTLVGAAAPPLVEGAIQAGGAVARPIAAAVTGALRPETEAAKRVTGAIERDIRADPAAVGRLTPQEFAAAHAEGAPVTVMEMGGETTRALARSAANTSPEGRAALGRTIDDRFEGQGPRITDWLRGAFNFPNADAAQRALETTGRAVNRAAYTRAYREGSDGLWSPELERLAGSDAVTAAMQSAARKARDESIVSGYGAMNPRITFTPDGRMQFNRAPNGTPTYPDLQYWDLVRRELSDAAQNAGRGTSESRRLGSFARALNEELDRLVPSYQQARQGAAAFFNAENALEAGQNYVMANFANTETRRALAAMTPVERQLFQDGFVSRFIETLERTGDRRNVLNTIANNPAAREKLNIALGPQRAAELEARLRVEGIMDLARGAVQGNSTTARQLAELGFAGGAGSLGAYGTYNLDPTQITAAALMGGLLAGRRHIDHRVAGRVAEMLTSNDPRILQRGIQILTRNNRLMNNLRATDARLAAAGGEQGAAILPTPAQGAMRAAAEDEQQ